MIPLKFVLIEVVKSWFKRRKREASYNWDCVGPGGCDTHCIEHPCGPCITGRMSK